MTRESWNPDKIRAQLGAVVAELGYMPSADDLRDRDMNALACVVSRKGYAWWREELGALVRPPSRTSTGNQSQKYAISILEQRGFHVVEQTHKAPFDLLVDGIRVDVKSGRYFAPARGYVFSIKNSGGLAGCDAFLLAPLSEELVPLSWYVVPEYDARVDTVTLTSQGKYETFRDAFHHLGNVSARRST